MCGAHMTDHSWSDIYEHYSGFLDSMENTGLNDIQPHYALRPTLHSPIVRIYDGVVSVENAHWGLVPPWWKEDKPPKFTINAKRESIEEQLAGKRGMWGSPFKKSRCLIVTGGFYEWTGEKGNKLPWYIHMKGRALFSYAGMASWHEEFGVNYTIITAPPSDNIAHIHNRMPVVMKPKNYSSWLSPDTSPDEAVSLLDDHGDGDLIYYRVSKELVNYQKNVPEAIEKVAA